MARYLERAENTARLLSVHQSLLLDLPRDIGIGWIPLLDILGCREAFASSGADDEAETVQAFIRADAGNPSSLVSSLNQARENARTTRDLLPTEAWRAVNELYLYGQKYAGRKSGRSRHEELAQIVSRCQTIAGLFAGTMSRGAPYQFIRLGRNLERADMTTRLVDVAAALLLSGREELARYDNTLWMAILKSTSAYQMYRQHVRRRVHGPDVIEYIMKDTLFPRAVVHCLSEVHVSLGVLPLPQLAQGRTEELMQRVRNAETDTLNLAVLHDLIDALQIDIAAIHAAIGTTWFLPEEKYA
jgi:uncharacterized alpha-E superfamily protein